jgi:hypothetical protein
METLNEVKTLNGGKIQAVHHWPQGWQMLEFSSREEFNKRKASVEAKNESRKPIQLGGRMIACASDY